ncbi:MAG: hypothetical protein J5680_05330 [Neisseriaceae bacterium]|nr:hypothetical protein [Neisseriaceae bacterium]
MGILAHQTAQQGGINDIIKYKQSTPAALLVGRNAHPTALLILLSGSLKFNFFLFLEHTILY